MKTKHRLSTTHLKGQLLRAAPLLLALLAFVPSSAQARGKRYCSDTAAAAYNGCKAAALEDYYAAKANCVNIVDKNARAACKNLGSETRKDDRDECKEQYAARRDLCRSIGEAQYAPDFRAANFVNPNDIGGAVAPHPLFPLVPGNTWQYAGGDETIVVTVTNKTKVIEGVTCRVVTDVVQKSGVDHEVTDDWFAQDLLGNVWYCGEISQEYELFPGDSPAEAELVEIEGSWKAGRDGALPGIIMLAGPTVGQVYREEMFLGDAEDVAEVLSVTGTESAPGGACSGNCLVTRNFTPLDSDANESKYYAPGIGLILEIGSGGARTQLVQFTPGP